MGKDRVAPQKSGRRPDQLRLQRYLADAGLGSRRACEELISAGQVKVNGSVVTAQGVKINPAKDKIECRGKIVRQEEKGLLIFNKPINIVSTMDDPEGRPCVADYLTSRYRSYAPVGRLDFESTGLMIFTNDGELAEMLLHPRYEIERTYEVTIDGFAADGFLDVVERGVRLDDGFVKVKIDLISRKQDQSLLEVSLKSGKNRVIRRFFEKLGRQVLALKRVRHGPFQLAGLRVGGIRRFSERDYLRLRADVLKEAQKPAISLEKTRKRPRT